MSKEQKTGFSCSLQTFVLGLLCVARDTRQATTEFFLRKYTQTVNMVRAVARRADSALSILGSWRFVKAFALLVLALYSITSAVVLSNVVDSWLKNQPIDADQLLWSKVFGSFYMITVLALMTFSLCRRGRAELDKRPTQAQ